MDRSSESRLIQLLAELAYQEGDIELASGRHSTFYLDAKLVTYHPEGIQLVGEAVLSRIQSENVAGVGGLTLGADAMVASTVATAARAGLFIPGFIVRKEQKKHGLGKVTEGIVPPPGSKVAILDDVITSGGSVLRAIRAVREQGLEVAVVVALVDREEGGAAAIENAGVTFKPICTVSDVRAVYERSVSSAAT